ncbi:MAG: GNAT family N-acetyltransferase [Bacteroidota bacterium]
MTISIHTLSDADLEAADGILSSAFQRAESWQPELRLFQRLQPDGIFLASRDGIPAGMVASIIYSDYAFVGLMGIHQDSQRQGLGLALMEHLLGWMEEQKVPLVKLDASPAGQLLYEKLGFVPFGEVYVFQRSTSQLDVQRAKGIQLLTPQHLDRVTAADIQAFGTDRRRLLRAFLELYPGRAFLSQNEQKQVTGYLFAQTKRIGPWVMTGGDAEQLLNLALSLPFNGPVSVVTPAENTHAVSLLQEFGFQITRVNCHMAYGPRPVMGQREKVYGQTSLSFG